LYENGLNSYNHSGVVHSTTDSNGNVINDDASMKNNNEQILQPFPSHRLEEYVTGWRVVRTACVSVFDAIYLGNYGRQWLFTIGSL